jgi:outer membrane beta-barrel protein
LRAPESADAKGAKGAKLTARSGSGYHAATRKHPPEKLHLHRLRSIVLVLLLSVPMLASAQDEKAERQVHVLEQRPFLHSLRVEVQPLFGYTVNEVMYEYLQVGGALRFHINEEWSLGGNYGHYFSDVTSAFESVQEDFELFPEKSLVKWYAGGEVAWTPLYGKAIVFGSWIMHWNAYITVGGGVTKTASSGVRPTGVFGLGGRVFLTDWLTFNLEVRDHIYSEPFKAGDELINNVVLFSGFGIFIPFGYDYVYPK